MTDTTPLDELRDVVASLFEAGAQSVEARRTPQGTLYIKASRAEPMPTKQPLRVK